MVIESCRIHFQSNINEETKEDTPPNSLALIKDYDALLWNRGGESHYSTHGDTLNYFHEKHFTLEVS